MGADRGIDPARAAQLVVADDLLIQRLPHAVQALELILAGDERAGHAVDRRDRVGIMGGELREHRVGCGQQRAGAGEIADVGVDLPGEHRKALKPVDLGALDLAVPVGALDQADHEPVAAAPCEIDQPADHVGAAFLICLHHEADAVPAGQRRVVAQRLQQVERELQPFGFLSVDVEADVIVARQHR